MKRQSLLVIFIAFAFSCKQPEFAFDVAQPVDIKEQKDINKRLIGIYQSMKDSSTLNISKELILRSGFYIDGSDISKLDNSLKLIGDTLIEIKTNQKVVVKKNGDSITWRQKYTDTIFSKKRNDVIKKFKGYFFINRYYKDLGWEVKKIKLKKGIISISDISSESDIVKLKAISENKFDTLSNQPIKLSKKEFKKFIKQNGFEDEEIFIKRYGS